MTTDMVHDISVIICAYTEDRWNDLVEAVESVQQQTLPPREIIIVIDHNPGLLKRVREHISGVVAVENTGARGLRGARNSGIAVAQGQIVAFLDDDAVAIPDWLMFLYKGYADPQVMGTGGAVIPWWIDKEPAWFPEEFYWVIGCDYRGMPQTSTAIRNPFGANMSMRRDLFDTVGDFHAEIVRVGPRHAGGSEEMEWCIRARRLYPHRIFLYEPEAIVLHRVPGFRTSLNYYIRRSYIEGAAKAVVTWYMGAKDSLATERTYTFRTLPLGVVRGLADVLFHRDLSGAARVGAIVVGLAVTTAGYLITNVTLHATKSKAINAPGEALEVTKAKSNAVMQEDLRQEAEIPLTVEA